MKIKLFNNMEGVIQGKIIENVISNFLREEFDFEGEKGEIIDNTINFGLISPLEQY